MNEFPSSVRLSSKGQLVLGKDLIFQNTFGKHVPINDYLHTSTDCLTETIRWFLSDVFSQLTYGEPIGCVAQGRDVNGLIQALQNLYAMSATIAVLPWLLLPLLRNSLLRKYLLAYTTTFKSMKKLYLV